MRNIINYTHRWTNTDLGIKDVDNLLMDEEIERDKGKGKER